MKRRVVVTAPGKVILMGEHAAVYGRPAVVAALDLRTTVVAERIDRGITMTLETLQHEAACDWSEIVDYSEEYAERWRRFDSETDGTEWRELADSDPARVVRLALGETARAIGERPAGGLRLIVTSEIPVGSGFGSSASVASAVAAGVLALNGETALAAAMTSGLLASIVFEVERRQHGRPSGVDHTTVQRGGILWIETAGERRMRPIEADPATLSRLAVCDTGVPAESTGEVVAAVRRRRREEGNPFDCRLDRMEETTRTFASSLARPGGAGELAAAIRRFERDLEELGIVPTAVRGAIRALERTGGAAKISGAGTLTGTGAGALLVFGPAAASEASGYSKYHAAIGAPGLRLEEAV